LALELREFVGAYEAEQAKAKTLGVDVWQRSDVRRTRDDRVEASHGGGGLRRTV
jgi:hypothetical protein